MRYRIISVGRIREKFYQEGINEYLKRLRPYASLELIQGLEEKVPPRAREKEIARILDQEARRILSLVGAGEWLVLLDVQGAQLTSDELAQQINNWNMDLPARINFVIGGAHGVAPMVKKQAGHIFSLSTLTYPHQMVVLLLCEQLYRSYRIIRGEPYHR